MKLGSNINRTLLIAIAIAFASVATLGGNLSWAGPMEVAKEIFEGCAGCHGEAGEGVEDMGPRLNGQQPWYLRRQIKKFHKGYRGYNEDDDTGAMMRDAAEAIEDNKTLSAVIAYIATLKLTPGEKTLEGGNPKKGEAIWVGNCTFCHGEEGQGSQDFGAPRLAGQSDWYLVGQLNKFRSGLRGAHEKDTRGKQMQSMSLILPDEQSVLDVATFISQMK